LFWLVLALARFEEENRRMKGKKRRRVCVLERESQPWTTCVGGWNMEKTVF